MAADVALAAWWALTADPGTVATVGPGPIADGISDVWIWRTSLGHAIENSEQVGVVLSERGGWASPNEHNTARFPRLMVEIWADPTRNPDRSVRVKDAEDKARVTFEALDKVLHTVSLAGAGGGARIWGDQRVLGSSRLSEPVYDTISDGVGMVRASVYYGVMMG